MKNVKIDPNVEKNALFVKKVTTMTSSRKMYEKFDFNKADDGAQYFLASRKDKHYSASLNVGDTVLIAKMRKNLRSDDYIWDVYAIKLAQSNPYKTLTRKELLTYKPHPKTWFKGETYLVM